MSEDKKMLLLLFMALSVVAALCGCLSSQEESPLKVTNMDIVPGQVKTSTIELKITTYIKNNDEGQGDIETKNTSLLLKATSTDREFLANQSTAFVGKISPGKTVNVTQTLVLPKKGGYKLQAQLFEDDKEMATGYRSVYSLESVPADIMTTGLRIDGIDFLVRKAEGEKVNIDSDIYITNTGGKPSQDYRLMIKATDVDSELVADKQWSSTGVIAPDETAIRRVNLTVPDRYNYIVDVLLWSNSTIVGQGQDYVQLNATTMLGEKERQATRGTRTGSFVTEASAAENKTAMMQVGTFESPTGAEKKVPGFEALTAVGMMGLVALAARRRR